MNVQVTKDSFGIIIWKSDASLKYDHAFNKTDDRIWQSMNYWFERNAILFNSKKVKKFFPDEFKDMKIGDIRIYKLTFKQVK